MKKFTIKKFLKNQVRKNGPVLKYEFQEVFIPTTSVKNIKIARFEKSVCTHSNGKHFSGNFLE